VLKTKNGREKHEKEL